MSQLVAVATPSHQGIKTGHETKKAKRGESRGYPECLWQIQGKPYLSSTNKETENKHTHAVKSSKRYRTKTEISSVYPHFVSKWCYAWLFLVCFICLLIWNINLMHRDIRSRCRRGGGREAERCGRRGDGKRRDRMEGNRTAFLVWEGYILHSTLETIIKNTMIINKYSKCSTNN